MLQRVYGTAWKNKKQLEAYKHLKARRGGRVLSSGSLLVMSFEARQQLCRDQRLPQW